MIRPFSPDDALQAKAGALPHFVLEAVNTLLARSFSGTACLIHQNAVIELATKIGADSGSLPDGFSRQMFFDEHWLDFEGAYQQAGWKVSYDKPGYSETYEAFWRFERDAEREAEKPPGRRW